VGRLQTHLVDRRFRRSALPAAVIVCFAIIATVSAAAQFGRYRGGRSSFGRGLTFATPEDFDGGFQFCRVVFQNAPDGDGNGWEVDWPRADENLSTRLSELTRTSVSMDRMRQPKHLLIRLTDPELFHCPFVMMTEPGGAYFADDEAAALGKYLRKGGFLWADDFWGTRAFDFWANQIGKALPRSSYPIVDLSLDHPLFHTVLAVPRIPQIPGINWWMRTGGNTSERGADSAEPHVRAILDDHGRIMVLMTHNTDFGDSFEEEATNHEYFLQFSVPGYAFGVDTLVYSMTH
jgi:hypothetical protein